MIRRPVRSAPQSGILLYSHPCLLPPQLRGVPPNTPLPFLFHEVARLRKSSVPAGLCMDMAQDCSS